MLRDDRTFPEDVEEETPSTLYALIGKGRSMSRGRRSGRLGQVPEAMQVPAAT
jgi:hypothetical protein